jgi:hypothetical protein
MARVGEWRVFEGYYLAPCPAVTRLNFGRGVTLTAGKGRARFCVHLFQTARLLYVTSARGLFQPNV